MGAVETLTMLREGYAHRQISPPDLLRQLEHLVRTHGGSTVSVEDLVAASSNGHDEEQVIALLEAVNELVAIHNLDRLAKSRDGIRSGRISMGELAIEVETILRDSAPCNADEQVRTLVNSLEEIRFTCRKEDLRAELLRYLERVEERVSVWHSMPLGRED